MQEGQEGSKQQFRSTGGKSGMSLVDRGQNKGKNIPIYITVSELKTS